MLLKYFRVTATGMRIKPMRNDITADYEAPAKPGALQHYRNRERKAQERVKMTQQHVEHTAKFYTLTTLRNGKHVY